MNEEVKHTADLAAFYRDEQTGQFNVEVRVTGTVYLTVEAHDRDAARKLVEAMIEKDEIELFGSDIEDADIDHVRACPTMYLVMRDGREMGVSRVQPGDEPCVPTSEYTASRYLPPATQTPENPHG